MIDFKLRRIHEIIEKETFGLTWSKLSQYRQNNYKKRLVIVEKANDILQGFQTVPSYDVALTEKFPGELVEISLTIFLYYQSAFDTFSCFQNDGYRYAT